MRAAVLLFPCLQQGNFLALRGNDALRHARHESVALRIDIECPPDGYAMAQIPSDVRRCHRGKVERSVARVGYRVCFCLQTTLRSVPHEKTHCRSSACRHRPRRRGAGLRLRPLASSPLPSCLASSSLGTRLPINPASLERARGLARAYAYRAYRAHRFRADIDFADKPNARRPSRSPALRLSEPSHETVYPFIACNFRWRFHAPLLPIKDIPPS